MAHFQSSTATSGPAPAIQAGVNWNFATYTLAETLSGSNSIAMVRLPGGARVVDCYLMQSNTTSFGTGAELVSVSDGQGNTYIQSAAISTAFHAFNPTYASIGKRLTSSASLIVALHDFVKTGTASVTFSIGVGYLTDQDKD